MQGAKFMFFNPGFWKPRIFGGVPTDEELNSSLEPGTHELPHTDPPKLDRATNPTPAWSDCASRNPEPYYLNPKTLKP